MDERDMVDMEINANAMDEDLECPFCDADGFDKIGLKHHLLGKSTFSSERLCGAFADIEDI